MRALGLGLATWLLSLGTAAAQDPTPVGVTVSSPVETRPGAVAPIASEAAALRSEIGFALRHGDHPRARQAVRRLREVAPRETDTLWLSGQVHLARGAVQAALLAAELDGPSRAEVTTAYEAFLPLNRRFLAACVGWQDDPVELGEFVELIDALNPVLDALTHVRSRFGSYGSRLPAAGSADVTAGAVPNSIAVPNL